ncbi:transposable element Tc3 transposase [Trichonephila clavipes]|nr:transposable element Tc3 transposase [Trichonephila clavipes]
MIGSKAFGSQHSPNHHVAHICGSGYSPRACLRLLLEFTQHMLFKYHCPRTPCTPCDVHPTDKRTGFSETPMQAFESECNAPYDSPGLIKDLDKLDTTYFPVSNFLANMLDPAARIHMEVTYEAIADAGYDASNLKGQRIGVFNATTAEDSIKMNTVDESFINLQGVRTMNPNRTTYVMDFTVNGDRYRAMITNFFIPELNNHDVQELWFQQDGATCHTARATIDLLKDTFGDRLISRFGPVNWPPRSCDLTPLDYFLWGYVKSLVYAYKPQTLDHLEDNISRVIADIRPQMLEKVIENWTSRLDYIRATRGSPMPEIIFKI